MASTSTSTLHHGGLQNPFAFLDSGKQYVTMIREVLPPPLRPAQQPSKTIPLSRSAAAASRPMFASSSSSSTASSTSSTLWNDSSSDEDEEEEELATPPASPLATTTTLPPLHHHDHDQDVKPRNRLEFPFSWHEVSQDDEVVFVDDLTPRPPPPPRSEPKLVPTPTTTTTRTTTTTVPTSRSEEERQRGRTRSPRLLWRSNLCRDDDEGKKNVETLDVYHRAATGGRPLPRLTLGMSTRDVTNWSLSVERAGI
ncbi:hypothetical protein JCM3766R1_004139 [Sporobolomyces carnicolor]